jgi:hypothetical protein
MCLLPTTGLLNTMHLTTMQLIFGPRWIFNILMSSCQQLASSSTYHYYATDLWSKVDIQHFNVSSCQQLASLLCLTTMHLIFGPRWIFNILMCPLANNLPQYYAPHYYATDLWSKEWIFNILMCPLANNWPPQYYTSLLCNWSWSKWIFNILMCPLATGLLNTMHLTTMQLIFGPKRWIF